MLLTILLCSVCIKSTLANFKSLILEHLKCVFIPIFSLLLHSHALADSLANHRWPVAAVGTKHLFFGFLEWKNGEWKTEHDCQMTTNALRGPPSVSSIFVQALQATVTS